MKKKKCISVGVSMGTVIGLVALFKFFTGCETLPELCGKKEEIHPVTPPSVETTVIRNDSNSNTEQINGSVGVIVKGNAQVGTINQQTGGENNIQYNIISNE